MAAETKESKVLQSKYEYMAGLRDLSLLGEKWSKRVPLEDMQVRIFLETLAIEYNDAEKSISVLLARGSPLTFTDVWRGVVEGHVYDIKFIQKILEVWIEIWRYQYDDGVI